MRHLVSAASTESREVQMALKPKKRGSNWRIELEPLFFFQKTGSKNIKKIKIINFRTDFLKKRF
jgi:hypothetical protein